MSAERKKILDKAKKLKELADRGVGGEMANAKEMLSKYMEKHNITFEEIESHDYSSDTVFSGMSDKEFLNEMLKDVLAVGIGLVLSSFLGGGVNAEFKEKSINMLKNKYSKEIKNRNKK
jgi:hypothetical protein